MERPTLVQNNQQIKIQPFDYRRFYPYYSKPKMIPIIRMIVGWIFIFCLGLFLLSNLLISMLEPVDGIGPLYRKILVQSIYYLYPFVTLYAIYSAFQKKHFDSEKYSISLLFTVIIVAYKGFWAYSLFRFQGIKELQNGKAFEIWKVFNILQIILIIVAISLQFALVILRPKVDPERVKKMQQEIQKKAIANLAGKEYEINLKDLE